MAQVKFPGMGEAEDEDSSGAEESEVTKAMVASHNRKGKKSGGFQSMGEQRRKSVPLQLAVYTLWCLHSGFSYAVYKGLMRKGYRVPTPIQRKVRKAPPLHLNTG